MKTDVTQEIISVQGNVIKKWETNSEGAKEVSCTLRSELTEALLNAYGLDFYKEEGLKLKVYELAEKIQKNDNVDFSKEDLEIISKVIANLTIDKYGFICKTLNIK